MDNDKKNDKLLLYAPKERFKIAFAKIIDVGDGEKMVIRSRFNPKGKHKLAKQGYNILMPWEEATMISKGKYMDKMDADEYADGKFRLNGGLGQDIVLKMSPAYEYNESDTETLLQQKKTYQGALKTLCEHIVERKLSQIVANKKLSALAKENMEAVLNTLRAEMGTIEVEATVNKYYTRTADRYEIEIAKAALELDTKYGIHLSEIKIPDIDYPEQIKAVLEKEKIAATERKIELDNAKNKILVSKLEAKANTADIRARVKAYLELGYSRDKIIEIEKFKNFPENSVMVHQQNDNDNIADIISGTAATKKLK